MCLLVALVQGEMFPTSKSSAMDKRRADMIGDTAAEHGCCFVPLQEVLLEQMCIERQPYCSSSFGASLSAVEYDVVQTGSVPAAAATAATSPPPEGCTGLSFGPLDLAFK